VSSERADRRGAFVFVVGPSGAGKDTLLTGAKQRLADDARIVFVRRTVTRPVGPYEHHDSLLADDFAAAAARGEFMLTWTAHGLSYGVPATARTRVAAGDVVVCNGSRAAEPAARAVFPEMTLVLITAPRAVRLARLTARGREGDVTERLDRLEAEDFAVKADLVIDNSGDPAAGVAELCALLRRLT
jgi:ribose 1,5-bisphosphokinase